MADVLPIQTPQPLQVAQHLHNAANEIAKFDNLPEFNNNRVLQAIQGLSNQLRDEMTALRRDVNNQVTALRRDMTRDFARLRASIETT